jgi:NAD(P)-dependent dehydrogenase (short-subunit alcohol dehydrogenase family)
VPRNAALHSDELMADALRGGRMVHRAGSPDDVAAAVSFLASSGAEFITGTTLNVDGGLLAKAPVTRVAQRLAESQLAASQQGG